MQRQTPRPPELVETVMKFADLGSATAPKSSSCRTAVEAACQN